MKMAQAQKVARSSENPAPTQNVVRSSGNVFADLGFKNPEEELFKANLVLLLRREIEQTGLTQQEAADIMGLKQPDVSKLLSGKIAGFSLERVLACVRAFNNEVEVKVKKNRVKKPGKIRLLEVA
jgi:predicted XRE-type DNA-binding protein